MWSLVTWFSECDQFVRVNSRNSFLGMYSCLLLTRWYYYIYDNITFTRKHVPYMLYIEARPSLAIAYLHNCPPTTTGCENGSPLYFPSYVCQRNHTVPRSYRCTNKLGPLIDLLLTINQWSSHDLIDKYSILSSNY